MKPWMHCACFVFLIISGEGCVVVPIPNRTVDGYGVDSQVVDAQTHAPIPHAKIYALYPNACVEADAHGRFRITPDVRWHAGYLFGVISYPIWPYTKDTAQVMRNFRVVAAGYEDQEFIALPDDCGDWNERSKDFCVAGTIRNDTFYVPSVPLRNKGGPRPALPLQRS